MRITNKKAFQAHPVPKHAYYARDPFDREVTAAPEMLYDKEDSEFVDDLDEQPKLFNCKICGEVLTYDETRRHDCEE
jgi:hypothetical protein